MGVGAQVSIPAASIASPYVRKTRFDIIERIKATLEKLVEINKDKHFRLITDLHNSIWFENEDNNGTTVHIKLPKE